MVDVFQVRIPGEFCFACILTFLQIGHFKGGPNCLQSFLSNPHILKSGHNVTQDLKWLEKEYNSPVKFAGAVELAPLAKE